MQKSLLSSLCYEEALVSPINKEQFKLCNSDASLLHSSSSLVVSVSDDLVRKVLRAKKKSCRIDSMTSKASSVEKRDEL